VSAVGPKVPRVAPVEASEVDAETKELLDALGDPGRSNLVRTLARHPRIFKRWVRYHEALTHGTLGDRHRELLILRAAYRAGCDQEWTQHQQVASRIGLRPEEVSRTREALDPSTWSPVEAALLRAVDELVDHASISDATWQQLAAHYEEAQLIEIPMVVGFFFSMGVGINTWGTQEP